MFLHLQCQNFQKLREIAVSGNYDVFLSRKRSEIKKNRIRVLIMSKKEYSDKITTIEELKEIVKAFCEARDWDQFHNAKDLAIALSIEAGELLEIFRWKNKDEVESIFREKESLKMVKDEMADVLYFLLRIAQIYGIDLSESLKEKLSSNEEKYPVHKFKGSNKKYSEV